LFLPTGWQKRAPRKKFAAGAVAALVLLLGACDLPVVGRMGSLVAVRAPDGRVPSPAPILRLTDIRIAGHHHRTPHPEMLAGAVINAPAAVDLAADILLLTNDPDHSAAIDPGHAAR